ncbi:MAG: alpha/beta fold hydrolase, partial [Pseudomonadota bacterium]
MGSAVDALIDAAYATALDHRVSKAFAAAYQAIVSEGTEVDTLSGHISRAREIASSRTAVSRLDLPNFTVCAVGGVMGLTTPDLKKLTAPVERVNVPGYGELQSPRDWRHVVQWAMDGLPPANSDGVFATLVYTDGERHHAVFRNGRTNPADPPKLRIVFPSVSAAGGDLNPDVLQRMLGLTTRQSQIALQIAKGASAGEIAKKMGIRVHTVRDHVKSIYERTEVNKQTDLAMLIGELGLMARTLESAEETGGAETGQALRRMTNFFWRSDGRRICFSDCGDPFGRVVLKTHSSFGGRWVWEPTAQLLSQFGIRLLIVERPGVGLTDPSPGDRGGDTVSDAIALLDHLGIDKAYGLGTSGGTFHAAEMVAAHPNRFTGAAFLSPRAFEVGPPEPDDYVAQVSNLPLDAGALIMESMAASQTDESWETGIRNVLDVNSVDIAALEDQALMAMHVRQQKSAIINGFEGQLMEWRDYGTSRQPPALPDLPYSVIVGRDDNLAYVQDGARDWSDRLGCA